MQGGRQEVWKQMIEVDLTSHSLADQQCCRQGGQFTKKYLMTILSLSYDNAKVMID